METETNNNQAKPSSINLSGSKHEAESDKLNSKSKKKKSKRPRFTIPRASKMQEEEVLPINTDIVDLVEPIAKSLRLYHRHEVRGLENIPKRGKAILAVNHSLATYDIALLVHAVYHHSGRLIRPLIDRLFYKIPFLGDFMGALGCSSGNKNNALKLIEDKQLILIAPGGMREALRPHNEKYQTKWGERKGFIRTSIETQTPIILGICPMADDLYKVYPWAVTKWMYKYLKLPVFVATGVGYSPIPKPVKLTHYLSKPIKPPRMAKDPEKLAAQIERFHKKVIGISEQLMIVAMEKNLVKEKNK